MAIYPAHTRTCCRHRCCYYHNPLSVHSVPIPKDILSSSMAWHSTSVDDMRRLHSPQDRTMEQWSSSTRERCTALARKPSSPGSLFIAAASVLLSAVSPRCCSSVGAHWHDARIMLGAARIAVVMVTGILLLGLVAVVVAAIVVVVLSASDIPSAKGESSGRFAMPSARVLTRLPKSMAWWLSSWVSRSTSERKKADKCALSIWVNKSVFWFDDRSTSSCASFV